MTMLEAFTEAKSALDLNPVVLPPNCKSAHGYVINDRGEIRHHISSMSNLPTFDDLTSNDWRVEYDD